MNVIDAADCDAIVDGAGVPDPDCSMLSVGDDDVRPLKVDATKRRREPFWMDLFGGLPVRGE